MHPPETLTLAELGVDVDPGTSWHPRPDHPTARDAAGHLVDLTHDQVLEHQAKPETAHLVDAGELLAAEDSVLSPEGEV